MLTINHPVPLIQYPIPQEKVSFNELIKLDELITEKIRTVRVNGMTNLKSNGLKARVESAPTNPKNIY